MSTRALTTEHLEASFRGRVDFPTWLPAMLVKELRQGLRARGFVGSVVLFQVLMTLILVFAVAGGLGSNAFNLLQGAFWVMLNVQLLIVTPARALAGLQGELEGRSVDLLVLTRLTAWRIVLGKWISLLVQTALLVIAMMPYAIARYFFGSIDLIGEMKIIALLFLASAVLTAAGLWCSGLPRLGRFALGGAVFFLWQFVPGSMAMIFSGGRTGGTMRGAALSGFSPGVVLWDAAIVLAVCLVGAVRHLAPRAESQSPLLRALPLVALGPLPFLDQRMAAVQLAFAGLLFAFVALIELARPEEPQRGHWRTWSRRGAWGRLAGRFVQPGWASAVEWVCLLAGLAALAGFMAGEGLRATRLALLGAEALVFPALLLTWMSGHFTQRLAGYFLVFGGASLISAVAAASSSVISAHSWADTVLLLLPIASFWSSLPVKPVSQGLVVTQIAVAVGVLGLAWWRARPYRLQRRQFDAVPA